jgi:hypothetical protein
MQTDDMVRNMEVENNRQIQNLFITIMIFVRPHKIILKAVTLKRTIFWDVMLCRQYTNILVEKQKSACHQLLSGYLQNLFCDSDDKKYIPPKHQ